MSQSARKTTLLGALVGVLIAALGLAAFRVGSDGEDCPSDAYPVYWSTARIWNEAALDAVRRDLPAPTVHARNLFHTSVAMWDAWAAYDEAARGYLVDEQLTASDVMAAREEAVSYAAFRVLESRYRESRGADETLPQLVRVMESLCYPIDVTTTAGDSPAALGNRIARTVLDTTIADGSNEAEGYVAPDYEPVNPPLVVAESGTSMNDPNRWQALQLELMISQNGILVENEAQEFIDPHWGHVSSFALGPAGALGLPVDPGPPPLLGDPLSGQEFKESAVEVIRFSSLLDPTDGSQIDISPGALGANSLGTSDGSGYDRNPITNTAYEPNLVNHGDFGRVVAEFWADGPDSETPPGHWNTLANSVSDDLRPDLRIGGVGEPVDRLEWDVKLYFALNGANHDAAVAAWGTKGHYDYVRPISMIRYMGGLGQSSDANSEAFHPDGLPLVENLIEVVTAESTEADQRHAALAGHEGEIAIRAWAGRPDDPSNEIVGVGWILAVDWVPYQLPTFVTPSFAAYVSGHSTFSRASAEVLTHFTGSEFFPGGIGEWVIGARSLDFEGGPDDAVVLQWATYADAADQAGISRLYGGIHVAADDFAGRVMGHEIGRSAWENALRYYDDPPNGES